jgi:hypothetical protein
MAIRERVRKSKLDQHWATYRYKSAKSGYHQGPRRGSGILIGFFPIISSSFEASQVSKSRHGAPGSVVEYSCHFEGTWPQTEVRPVDYLTSIWHRRMPRLCEGWTVNPTFR